MPAPSAPNRPQQRSKLGVVPGQSAVASSPGGAGADERIGRREWQQPIRPTARPVATASPTPDPACNLMFSPPGSPVAAGSTFQVPVVLTGGKDISSVPLQIQYDPAKLSLVNVTSGDLLSRDNQAVALVHRDDGPGIHHH